MALYTAEQKEEMYRLLRERMRVQSELHATGAPLRRPPSQARQRREQRLAALSGKDLRSMYRVSEVADLLGVSRYTVERWFRDRAVLVGEPKPGKRLRQVMLIPHAVFDAWLREHMAS
jgi:excisionase family DNA binding protein